MIRALVQMDRILLALDVYSERHKLVLLNLRKHDSEIALFLVKTLLFQHQKSSGNNSPDSIDFKECATRILDETAHGLDLSHDWFMKCALAFVKAGEIEDCAKCIGRAQESIEKLKSENKDGESFVGIYNEVIRHLGKIGALNVVFDVLDVMNLANIQKDNETWEFLANAAVRRVEFVKGVVSMDTMPDQELPEAMFIGRSNVGKSSLVNMTVGRKALAHTSKRPGKTQQFNYFVVNGKKDAIEYKDKSVVKEQKKMSKRAMEKLRKNPNARGNLGRSERKEIKEDLKAFYLVDCPGVGYAKVPKEMQESWTRFIRDFLSKSSRLRVVFHLIDGRHGPMDDDRLLLEMVSDLKSKELMSSVQFVIVLTKVDKLDKSKVKSGVMQQTVQALKTVGLLESTPIISTSSQSKIGRDEMWRYLRSVTIDEA
eukprot:CAMPEP_0182444018 /NCGR_PEP_ID=MMETSP1172-20130603/2599_1 /TAXON_ID=708627 /ORGANISM="Timspurckia oligopyrenoides, Strain CCMP3278" /LENGTH=426 /DNA_ID=CAMNT_0024639467 /DNA_START=347 /DNA_END=1627 /DNA_ORIENTATION=+